MARKFFVRTFGCQMNEHDSEQIAANLLADGLERTDELDDADVVVLNTCCIRENADNKFYAYLGDLKARRLANPDMQIAVGGCLAQKDGQAIVKRAPFVDAVFGTQNVSHASELLHKAKTAKKSVVEILDHAPDDYDAFPSAQHIRSELPYAAWVTIQIGCDNSCAFCVVPAVRGKEQSKPFGALIAEITELARTGTVDVTLLGQNVNSYGRDLTTRLRSATPLDGVEYLVGSRWWNDEKKSARPLFADLLRAVGEIDGIERIRYTSPHPKDLRPETIAAMAETPAVCEQLHLPLQSGSNRILSMMRRGYTTERYLERLAAARKDIPDLAVSTDLIVGFPGETDQDFEDTLALVADAGFDNAFTFIFSARSGTRAALMTDDFVPQEVIADRFARLKEVVDRSALLRNKARIGRNEEVIVEGTSKFDELVMSGRTRQAKLVHFPANDLGVLSPGTKLSVKISSAGAYHLSGDIVDSSIDRSKLKLPSRRPIRVPITTS